MRIQYDDTIIEYSNTAFDNLENLFWDLEKKDAVKILNYFKNLTEKYPKELFTVIDDFMH
jgi:hypothetical protein